MNNKERKMPRGKGPIKELNPEATESAVVNLTLPELKTLMQTIAAEVFDA